MKRLCVVTGATRGIGRAITDRLVRHEGVEVMGIARRRPADWAGPFIAADLSNPDDLSAVCDGLREMGQLWALVNNVGVGHAGSLPELDMEDLNAVFFVNTFAPALITQAAINCMSGGGRIVNVCSSAMLGRANRGCYGASKAALASFTQTWALELAPRRITVNAVSPGPIDTEMFRSRNPIGSNLEREVVAKIPLGRIGSPFSVAVVVEMLVDPRSYYITGQIVGIDGGSSLPGWSELPSTP